MAGKFLSKRAMANLKKDDAIINATAKRKGAQIRNKRVIYCQCGDPDCVGFIADYYKPKKLR